MTGWQTGGQPQQWAAAPVPPPWPPAAHQPPVAHRPPAPLAPTAAWLSAAVATVTAVWLVVLLTSGAVAHLLRDTGLLRSDADVLAALAGVLALGGLLGGAVGVLTGRGTGLMRVAGAAVAALAVLLVAVATVVTGDDGVVPLLGGLVIALGAGAASALAAGRAVAGWSRQVERRSAEREIAALSSGRRSSLPARGLDSLVLSVLLVVGVVLATLVSSAALAPRLADEEPAAAAGPAVAPEDELFASDHAGRVPVAPGDPSYDIYFDRLADECAEGDFERCDDLYQESPVGSDYETYGSTCGGRTTVAYHGDCDRQFG